VETKKNPKVRPLQLFWISLIGAKNEEFHLFFIEKRKKGNNLLIYLKK